MTNPYFDLIKAVWQYGKAWRPIIIAYYCALEILAGVIDAFPDATIMVAMTQFNIFLYLFNSIKL